MADNIDTSGFGAGDGMLLDYSYGGPDPNQWEVPLFNSGAANASQSSLFNPTISAPSASSYDFSQGITGIPQNNASTLQSDFGALGGMGGDGSTMGAVGGAVGTAASIYNNSSTDTTGSVLSGAASGAAAGTMIMPGIGTAIGAVVGGIIGFFGSKSKKNAEKKAFQQQEQLAVLPYQQQQANWLQKQGLAQQAISNYRSAFTPGGYQYKNALLGGPTNKTYGIPTQGPTLPNFNQAPPNVVPGMGNSGAGIAGNSVPNNGVNLTPGPITQPVAGNNPYYGFNAPAPMVQPAAPGFTGNQGQDKSNISNYQQQYAQYIQDQQQQAAAQSMNAYQPYFAQMPSYTNGVYS